MKTEQTELDRLLDQMQRLINACRYPTPSINRRAIANNAQNALDAFKAKLLAQSPAAPGKEGRE